MSSACSLEETSLSGRSIPANASGLERGTSVFQYASRLPDRALRHTAIRRSLNRSPETYSKMSLRLNQSMLAPAADGSIYALALSDASSHGSADLEPELTLFSRQTE